jgi:O-antigen ligase
MKFMKQLFNISSDASFYILLGFLALINFSIAGCYILYTLLLVQWIGLGIIALRNKNQQADLTPPLPTMPPLPGYYKYLLLFVLMSLVSTVFAIDRLNSLKDNKEFFVFLLIPVFLLIINSKKRLELTLSIVLISAAASALLGIGISLKEGISLDHRLQGFTSHWMTYSGLLMFPFIYFFIHLFYEKNKKRKIYIGITLVPILVSILLSLTRSMWVGIFVALGIFIVYYKPKILYLALPAMLIMILVLPGSVKTRVFSIFDPNNATNKDRMYMATVGIEIFKDYPLTGVGPNNVDKIYDKYKPAEAEQSNPHLHNNFLQVLAERGLLALISLLITFVMIFIHLIRKIKNGIGNEKTVAIGTLFVFVGFLVAGLFEYNLGDTEIKFLLFYFLSIPFVTLKPHAGSQIHRKLREAKGE